MVDLTKEIRKLAPEGFLLSHAPQTPYLTLTGVAVNPTRAEAQYYGSYLSIMAQVGGLGPKSIDFLNIQAYNNECCQGHPKGTDMVRNLSAKPPLPSPLPPILGGYKTPSSLPSQLVYGQLTSAATGQMAPPPFVRRTDLPDGTGMMFWLETADDWVIATQQVNKWFDPKDMKARGLLSPPVRVVYYLNKSVTGYLPLDGYSPVNTIILGFAYPALNDGTNSKRVFPVEPQGPVGSDVPNWASFGMYYAFGTAGEPYSVSEADTYAKWRSVDNANRKVMIGIGGAASAPIYSKWAEGTNPAVVAKGLFEFLRKCNLKFDGVDLDYEDSNSLWPWASLKKLNQRQQTGLNTLQAPVSGASAELATCCSSSQTTSASPILITILVVVVLLFVAAIVAVAFAGSRLRRQ